MEIKLVVPNIDIESILGVNEMGFKTDGKRQKYIDNIYYVLYSVVHQCNIQRRNFLKHGYVPLHSVLLKTALGNEYKKYILDLVDNGIIDVDKRVLNGIEVWHYSVGQSFSFRLGKEYSGVGTKIYEVKDWVLRKFLIGHRLRFIYKEDKSIIDFFDSCFQDLTIEYEPALEKLNELKRIIQSDESIPEDKRIIKANDMFISTKATLDQLHFKTYRPIFRDDLTQRVFSPITSLKRELKQYLRYKGEPLVVMDLANSQPFFVNYIFRDRFIEVLEGHKGLQSLLPLDSFKTIKKFCEQYPANIDLYRQLTSEGKLYDYLMAELSKLEINFINRNRFKDFFFLMFYSSNDKKYGDLKIVTDLMIKTFPLVMLYVVMIKDLKFKTFPILMQRVESFIMIDKIAKTIRKEHPSFPFFTIHDSILCLNEHAELIKGIMENEIIENTEVTPTITIEH